MGWSVANLFFFFFFGYVYSVAQLAFHLGDKLRFSYLLEIYIFYLIY